MQQIIGNYRIVRQLGEGGAGVVFEAEHVAMGRRAAIKLLRPELVRDQDLVRRFFNEARATNEIRHPGIVEVYDCGTLADGSPWLIMELLGGETLAARMARLGPLPVAQVIELGGQVASVLAAAHAAGIVHRDLKPENLFVVPDPGMRHGERIKVLDFGIAKLNASGLASPMTKTGAVMGTPLYMSPEQCRGGKQIDSRTDVYSLGVILYQMLAGEAPFVSDGIGELFHLHMYVHAAPLESKRPGIGRSLSLVVHKMLEKDPAARFQAMSELERALAGAGEGGATAGDVAAVAPELSPPPPPPSPSIVTGRGSFGSTTGTRVMPQSTTTFTNSAAEVAPVAAPRFPLPLRIAALGALAVGAVALIAIWRSHGHDAASEAAAVPPAAVAVPPAAVAVPPAAVAVPPAAARAPAASTGTAGAAGAAPSSAVAAATARTAVSPTIAVAEPTVIVEIATTPAGARVVDASNGRLLGTTPYREERPRGGASQLEVRIEKKGYRPRSATIPLDRDFQGAFALDPAPAARPASAGEHIIKL